MIKEFVAAWDSRKGHLEKYFKSMKSDVYLEYKDLVKALFDIVINPHLDSEPENYNKWLTYRTDNFYEINDGDYQGTLLYVLYKNVYQPSISDYVYTYANYGSCCCCDTLQHILSLGTYDDKYLSDRQVEELVDLCLHLLQNCHEFVEREY